MPRPYKQMISDYQQAIDLHRKRVFSFASYSLRAKEDAEDVTQEVFIKLWQHWQKIDHKKLGAWLMRVAHNAVIDHVRRQKPQQTNLDQYAEVDEQAARSGDLNPLDRRQLKEALQVAIKALDDPFRSIIIMRDVQGLSYADIQSSLDISESQVKVYLHRGRRKLRDNENLRNLFESDFSSGSSNSNTNDAKDEQDKGNRNVQ